MRPVHKKLPHGGHQPEESSRNRHHPLHRLHALRAGLPRRSTLLACQGKGISHNKTLASYLHHTGKRDLSLSIKNILPACRAAFDRLLPDAHVSAKLERSGYNCRSLAGVVQWQNESFPSFIRGFDSLRPLQFQTKRIARMAIRFAY